ncbi:MAG: tellurium resistance protein TerC, partial [Candidatus Planktophila sp.]
MNVTTYAWIALLAFVGVMLVIDLFLHRDHQVITFKEAAFWSSIWVACGLAVGGVIWYFSGSDFALQYYSGYF